MTEDLPLGHPAQEPDIATEARVRARVTATVRRRRARRRTLTTLPVIAVVALAAAAVLSTRGNSAGKDRQIVTAGTTNAELAFEPDVEWNDAVLSADGKTLTVTAGRVLHDSRGCQLKVLHDVVETDDSVTIGLKDATSPGDASPMACEQMFVPAVVKVPLDQPLGDRAVFDGVRPQTRTILRLSDLVQVGYVPAGFTTNPDDLQAGDPNVQQTYNADGADWYFAVNETKEALPADLAGATSAPIRVNDVEGLRITGQMNNTMESIRFPLGERTVTVWGEMQGPPTFTHADELLKIAEGIRLPGKGVEGHPAATTSVPASAPLRAASKVRLQASDWKTSSRKGTRSRAADARYTIASLDGHVLKQGTIDRSGRVVVTVRAASAMITVDQCNLEAKVVRLTPGETSTIEFPCGGAELDLPPQSIPKTTENPTDNELRAANQEAVSCIEAAGLTVSNSHLTVDASGHVSRGIQIGLADSGLTFDESGAVQAECEKRYLSLMFARGDWLMDHGR